MSDEVDQAQRLETAEREAAIASTRHRAHLPDRTCMRCGEPMPVTILEAHPDWLDCNGLCSFR